MISISRTLLTATLIVATLCTHNLLAQKPNTPPTPQAAPQQAPLPFTAVPSGKILATGSGRVCIHAPDGTIAWQHPTGNNADAWYLPNGNVLVADGNVWEVNPEHKIVWRYNPADQTGGGAFSCQRLPNGNTLIGENSTGRILEVDPQTNIVHQFSVKLNKGNRHQTMRMVRKLANGNYLVCHSGFNEVKEYAPDGTEVWAEKVPGLAFAAVRLPDGSTLISSLDQVQKYSPDHNVIWSFSKKDLPELNIRNMTGLHLLPNGNLIIGCYAAYHQGKGVGMFEITPDKKSIWAYRSPKFRDGSMMAVQLIGDDVAAPLR